jgi:hypothetical protein
MDAPPPSSPEKRLSRGLSIRSVMVALFALLLMGVWIEYEELYNNLGGPLAENSPPNSAICVVLVLFAISGILCAIRKWLRLQVAELVFIYCALLVAAPLMTQGMWHRFFGLVAAISHEQDFKSYESLPDMLWPHGNNLCVNGRFERGLEGFLVHPVDRAAFTIVEWRGRAWKCPTLSNPEDAAEHVILEMRFFRTDTQGRELLVPGEKFLFSMLVKAEEFRRESSYAVTMRADDGQSRLILLNTTPTTPTFANPGGFQRVGVCPLVIPREMRQQLTITISLNGPGKLTIHDLQFLNTQAVEGAYAGRNVVRQSNWSRLGNHERDFTLVKPDHMFSLDGLKYLLIGFIPLDQWIRPLLAWASLIGALFLGFLGFNVLMRKQWVENERLAFAMNILPRQLFQEEMDVNGRIHRPIFRRTGFWIGFGITLVLALLKGLQFYFPNVPAPAWDGIRLDAYVSDPLLKSYLQNVSIQVVFCLLAIALLVETDILFSIWSCFLIFQVLFFCGKAFNWGRYPGYPWEFQQSMGAFLGFAVLAVFTGRRHLMQVIRHIAGRIHLDDSAELVSYRWAAVFLTVSVAFLGFWGAWTGMGAWQSLLFFGYMMICGFSASKLRAECGAPHGYWMPYYGMMFAGATGGYAVFGSTGMLTATIASGFMCVACFFFIAPVQIEMMELGRSFGVRPIDVGWGLVLGLAGGIIIGGYVLLCWAYGFGADNMTCSWPYAQGWYFGHFREGNAAMDRAFAANALSNPQTAPLNFAENPDAKGIGIGFIVVCAIAVLRTTFMGFPFHPIGYVLAPTHFGRGLWFTCLLAWLIRLVMLRVGGAHSIRRGLIPFSVGMFLAAMVSIIIFDLVGIYLHSQGITNVYCKWP